MRSSFLLLAALLLPAPDTLATPVELLDGGTRVGISSWGPDCGPKPRSARSRRGARYTAVAESLVPVGAAPPLFGPGICRAATGLRQLLEGRTSGGFDCRSRDDSPKHVTGRIDRSATGDTITIRHRFTYDWALKGSVCSVLVQGTWRLRGETPPPPAAVETTPTPKGRCDAPGPPSRLVIHAEQIRLAPGEAVQLRARATDAAGCAVRGRPTWSTTAGRIDARGRLTAPLDGTVEVSAKLGAARATKTFRVALPEANLAAAPPSLAAPPSTHAAERSAAEVSGEIEKRGEDPLPWLRIGFVVLVLVTGVSVYRLLRR